MGDNKRMTIALFTGSVDKLTAAGIIISGAVAQDIDVDVFVLLQGARAFLKDKARSVDELDMAENRELREEFLASLERVKVKPWLEFFEEARDLASVKVYICGLAGKVWGGEKKDDFVGIVDDIVGIGECVSSMEEAEISLFI